MLMVFKRSRRESVTTRKDRGSMILLWVMITSGFTLGFLLSKPASQFWTGFGFAFIVLGLIIRWIAIMQLGNSFTVDVSISKNAMLKTDGIYEKIRHPSYLGMLLVVAGFGATMNSLYSLLVLVIPVFFAVVYRISVEERVLVNEFGNSFIKYAESTKKLIPGIF
jgi:protein-S-isoprenylcysteine O-methyltransferase Ste14